jgi:hypothetical protein
MRWPRLAALSALVCVLMGPPSTPAAAPSAAAQTRALAPLENPVWLCRPGLPNNPCNQDAAGNPQRAGPSFTNRYPTGGDVDLGATRVAAGISSPEPYATPSGPAVDCFYVYPTVDVEPNPRRRVGSEPPVPQDQHMATTLLQASRFARQCRIFAPVYRQATLSELAIAIATGTEPDFRAGLMDVEQAWLDYWDNHNVDLATGRRRGVVLIGHSQGAANLIRVAQEHIDGNPAMQDRIVSALLMGSPVTVPLDRPDGGGGDPGTTFQHLPACQRPSAADPVPVGCVVSYSAFAQDGDDTPVEGALFGRSTSPGHKALCVNPAALLSGSPGATTPIDAYLGTRRLFSASALDPTGALGSLVAGYVVADHPSGYSHYPDTFAGQCRFVEDAGGNWSWLNVTGGDALLPPGASTSTLGLHNPELNLTHGNLAALVAAQTEAWLDLHG